MDKITVIIKLNETETARWIADEPGYRDELKELARGICRDSGHAVETLSYDGKRLTKMWVDLRAALDEIQE